MSTSQRRAVVLATLLVTSVVAGTVAFTGTTAAQAASEEPSIVSVVEYDGNVEVVFSDEVRDATDQSALDGQTFDVEVDGTTYDATVSTDANPRYVLTGDWGDLNPTQDVTLTASDVQADAPDGPSVDRIAEEVDVTSVVLDGAETAHSSRGGAASVFAGEVIAVRSQSGDNYEIRDLTDSQAIQGGSLYENMSTFAFDTEDLDTGNSYRISFDDGATEKFFNVTDLGLEASARDVNTREDLTVDVETTWGNRPVTAELVGEDETRSATLDGQGEATVDFGQLDAGTYTVNVTDEQSGIVASTGTVEVVPGGDVDATFGEDAFVRDDVGDVAEIPIHLENTDTADVRIGSTDGDYWINATVEDEGDGTVNLLFDTASAGTHGTNEVLTVYTEAESDTIDVHEEGGTVSETDDAELDGGHYDLFVDTGVGTDIGTLSLQPAGDDDPEALPNNSAPNDPDDDGLFEDVNGDGATNLADAGDLFQYRETAAVQENVEAYDFSGNGEIDLADVVDLFQEATAA